MQQLLKKTTKVNMNSSHKNSSGFVKDRHQNSFLLGPINKLEILISSLDSSKSVRPNSIPMKMLKLLKNVISCQLAAILNISFSTGALPTTLKVVRVVPVYEKDSNLDFSNHGPNSLLFSIEIINVFN